MFMILKDSLLEIHKRKRYVKFWLCFVGRDDRISLTDFAYHERESESGMTHDFGLTHW